ncbi:MAG: hypothetical protein M1812_007446 [Candelaria pacifica]|nr:MAG: hypothetical protein M1812_007446 [Candelaria pacifica]
MKSYLSILLALSALSTVLAVPAAMPADDTSEVTDTTPEDASINNSKQESDRLSASLSTPTGDESKAVAAAAASKCIDITFQSSNGNWNYFFNGGWGSASGKVSALGTKSLCGSGALFVGYQTRAQGLGSAAGGNTKLECTVTGDGKVDNVCDVSVVDGYSLSMHCTGFGTGDIGGTQNLFSLGTCPKVNSQGGGKACVNTNGHSNNAAQFFKNGGKYWYQDNKYVGTTFGGNPKVTCVIGA